MTELHFLRPWWILGLIPLIVAVMKVHQFTLLSQNWERVVDPLLAPFVLQGDELKAHRWPSVLLGVIGGLMLIALAGPVWEKLPVPVFKGENKIVLVLDVSQSMDAKDIKPSRIVRARYKVGDMLSAYPEAQFGLVIFSQVPYIISPITDDAATVESLLPAVTTSVVPVQGSQLSLALSKAGELLDSSQANGGQVVVLTDSKATAAAFDAAQELKKRGYSLSILGVGTKEGSPVDTGDGQLLKDRNENIVLAKLDQSGLMDLARSVGGNYVSLQPDDGDIHKLIRPDLATKAITTPDENNKITDIWLERSPWLLPIILLLASIMFRRGLL